MCQKWNKSCIFLRHCFFIEKNKQKGNKNSYFTFLIKQKCVLKMANKILYNFAENIKLPTFRRL